MKDIVFNFSHVFSLKPDWQHQLVEGLGCTLKDNKFLYLPEELGVGSSCFLEVLPNDLSVLIIDQTLKKSISFTRESVDEDYWIIYYDLSDECCDHIVDNYSYKVGYQTKLGFGIVDCGVSSSYLAKVDERMYSLRIFIRKSLLKSFFPDICCEALFNSIFNNRENKMFFYGHIDSRSKVLLYQLKQRKIEEPYYEFLLKSTTLNLLGCLVSRMTSFVPITTKHLDKDIEKMLKSQKHLLSDLSSVFPGIDVLAGIAGMSVSKYKRMYKSIYKTSPGIFFKNEKLKLAKELLESGRFKTVSAVAYELGYVDPTYFSLNYKNCYGVLPSVNFIKEYGETKY
ncbi:helix-turn-helix transcriptional regulator [Flavobacterium sp. '19STA2R22 D10 B1']|uniref:helix-turn-helix transcriptional regulator n=1 Tax=Flavobacterium aerium TaxID=3037261 RepID=UPI00278BB663|nr:AraC family transcriptional regulator [Flavobacterium sp. '19STA2R22 D10 B1']